MTITKLGSFAVRLALFRRRTFHEMKNRGFKSQTNDEDLDKPIKFTTSKAATWNAVHNRTGPVDDFPWMQPYIVLLSTASFLVYFCILREENDIDEMLSQPLADHFTGEKREMLEKSMDLPAEIAKAQITKQ